MTVFFTSDTHFGDHRVLNIRPRPFSSVAEMDEALIVRWNRKVAIDDVVWHLGDVARTAKRSREVLPRLNGQKHLLLGNLDQDEAANPEWTSIGAYAEIEEAGHKLVLCHYPFRTWNGAHKGSLNLHGHSHGRLQPLKHQFDVGVDARSFEPIRLIDLLNRP